jgi:hypothetical protein
MSEKIIDCRACGACCRAFLHFYPEKPEMVWAHARGIRWIDNYLVVPSLCRYYHPMIGCTIQNAKPKVCKIMPVGGTACNICRKWMERELKEVL